MPTDPLSGLNYIKKKKRRICIRLPSCHLRLLALPIKARRQRQKPTLYSTGIYRCSILDFDVNLCENSKWPRISADKRSLCNVIIPYPPRGSFSAYGYASAKLIKYFEKEKRSQGLDLSSVLSR